MNNFMIGYVFPGQGSQAQGMLSGLYHEYSIIRETFEEASDQLSHDLWDIVTNNPNDTLNQTAFTQAIMFTSDMAIARLIKQQEFFIVNMLAGHSLGEYVALSLAGVFSFPEGVDLVYQRGQIMQRCVPLNEGSMAAIVGLSDDDMIDICGNASSDNKLVTPANFNAPGQVVVAGHTDAVNIAMILAEERGARLALKIPVSVPCHCPLLNEASIEFGYLLNDTVFLDPIIPVMSNLTALIYQNATDVKDALVKHLYSPVQWVKSVENMKKMGISHIVEIGPQKVLSGLIKRIDKSIKISHVNDLTSLEHFKQVYEDI